MEVTDQHLSEDLFQLSGRFKQAIQALAEKQGLTPAQLFALYAINKHSELAMGQAANALHCDASNITGLVDRLVAQGLVERRERPTDRRTKTLHLTAKGKQAIEDIRIELPKQLGWDILTIEERRVMHGAICKLIT